MSAFALSRMAVNFKVVVAVNFKVAISKLSMDNVIIYKKSICCNKHSCITHYKMSGCIT